jgi:hypothetical protein
MLPAIKRRLGDCHYRVLTRLVFLRPVRDDEVPARLRHSNKDGFSLADRTVLVCWDGRWQLFRHRDAPVPGRTCPLTTHQI